MAIGWTVTDRQFLNTQAVGGTSEATSSTTNTAAAMLLVPWMVAINSSGNNPVMSTPTGGSLTYNLIVKDGENDAWTYNASGTFAVGGAFHYAIVGSSPSAFAITVDGAGGADTGLHTVQAVDIIGYDPVNPIVQSGIAGANIAVLDDAASAAVTLGAAPKAGNLLVAQVIGSGTTSQPATPTAGVGKTMTTFQTSAVGLVAAYRVCDGTESATVTCSDLGTQVGGYIIQAVEILAEQLIPPRGHAPFQANVWRM